MLTKQLDSIQVLRAIAALWVVMFHTVGNATTYGWTSQFMPSLARHGEMGVDIFFVISGFVIALISYGKPVGLDAARRFVIARAARVIPLYWVLTSLFTALLIFAPSAFGHARFNLWHVISSFLFIPSLNWAGIVVPVINVGWTLNYEIWFYVLFTLAIATFQKPIRSVMIALVALALVHPLREGGIIWNFYTNSIVLEFAGGVILGTVYAKYKNIAPSIIFPLIPTVGLVIWQYDLSFTGENRFIALGLPAFLAVACALYFENRIRWNKFLCSLGDASYSLYLTHALTIPVCMKLIQTADQKHGLRGDIVCLMVIILSVAIAFACRRYLERPMTRIARRWLDQRASV
ncbi:acyltransferase family protein [Acetobacter peroxydans]|nr:acyltransferase [Acetobacter peroxydans]NHO17146.1 acyltransferase family protein [Acetobacter peroxydans]